MTVIGQLNRRADRLCEQLAADAELLKLAVTELDNGTRLFDLGVSAPGSLGAGLMMARVCMADLADVRLVPTAPDLWSGASVMVSTDHPVAACMAAQYAGWEVKHEDYFAMGSGPMRAAAGREALFAKLGCSESAEAAVGVLETGKLPGPAVCAMIAEHCGTDPSRLSLLVAPTRSLAGTLQIVARSVETALHKLMELGFDLRCVASGYGTAPLPPVAADDLAGIGRTNDAVLYGGQVTLFVDTQDEVVEQLGPQVPSSASPDHGQPFKAIFARYDHDFYKIDPHLFSPAVVTFCNLSTGKSFRYGRLVPRVIHESFGIA